MVRENETLIPPETRWLNDPDARAVSDALGGKVYFVGGCVRNALMGLPDSDVDMATPILPNVVMARAEAAGLQAVPTGFDHGTVTIISGGQGFEVTTFRRDVATDGRRAVIAFSDNIKDDARRRDFTMNALYATLDGALIDPLGGLPDLIARRVRFIEDAQARIREDYLRTLRYFRFHAWYGADDEGFDVDALDAIAANLDGLETLSAERVGAELSKLLLAPDPTFAVAGARQAGVLSTILPGSDDQMLGPLLHNEALMGAPANWLRRIAVLGGSDVGVRLRLSKAEQKELVLLTEHGFGVTPVSEVAYRYGAEIAVSVYLIRTTFVEAPAEPDMKADIESAAAQLFPLRARDLMDHLEGPALGEALRKLEADWIASGFELKRAALIARV